MIGSIASWLMDWRNEMSVTPDPVLQAYLNYGEENKFIPKTGASNATNVFRHAKYGSPSLHEALLRENRAICITQKLENACKVYWNEKKIAYRPVEKKVTEPINGKMMEITHLKETQYLTLGELWENITNFGKGLKLLGLKPGTNVCIFEETCWEWLASVYGLWSQECVIVTAYANLGEDGLCFALEETESAAVICNGKNVSLLLRCIATRKLKIAYILYLGELPQGVELEVPSGTVVMRWQEVVSLGSKSRLPIKNPTANDWNVLALIMYTSGTTGDPKGVMHTFGSLTTGVRALELLMMDILPVSGDPLSAEEEAYCAYLPLAHILEFGVVNVFLQRGALVGFGSARTLTDLTTRPHGDFAEYKPRVIVAVPRIFDTVRRAIEGKLPPPGTVKRAIFDAAYQARLQAIQNGNDTPYYNKKVFNKIRQLFGGKAQILLSGGAPMSASTKEFVSVVFGPIIINGWGLTETVCVGGVQRRGDQEPTSCGQALPMSEMKLVDTEEYKHTDKPEARGEICIRGPFLFKGYYKQLEMTHEVIDADGWFHTGDVGSITPEGRIKIVGRIKALAKNCLGEYIALETLESIYANHPLVLNNCLCVVVHPDRNYIGAILVTDVDKLLHFARDSCPELLPHGEVELGKKPDNEVERRPRTIEEMMSHPKFMQMVASSIGELGKNAKRCPFEFPRRVFLTLEEWTPENDILTVALKLKRRVVEEKYKKQIEEMFSV